MTYPRIERVSAPYWDLKSFLTMSSGCGPSAVGLLWAPLLAGLDLAYLLSCDSEICPRSRPQSGSCIELRVELSRVQLQVVATTPQGRLRRAIAPRFQRKEAKKTGFRLNPDLLSGRTGVSCITIARISIVSRWEHVLHFLVDID